MGLNILYVEDVSFIRLRLKGSLEDRGYRVFDAADSYNAYSLFKSKKIDLAIVDINIPYTYTDLKSSMAKGNAFKDGLELAKQMLTDNPNLHVIILSGNIKDDSMVVEGIGWGIKDFITKPYDIQRLVQSIESVRNNTPIHY